VRKNGGDIRDVISIGKLVRKSDGPEQIELIMETMTKYGSEGKMTARLRCDVCGTQTENLPYPSRNYRGVM